MKIFSDTFEDKAMRALRDLSSRLLRIDQHSRHDSTYVLADFSFPRRRLNKMRIQTLSQMEIINDTNPHCFACWNFHKVHRGMLHS